MLCSSSFFLSHANFTRSLLERILEKTGLKNLMHFMGSESINNACLQGVPPPDAVSFRLKKQTRCSLARPCDASLGTHPQLVFAQALVEALRGYGCFRRHALARISSSTPFPSLLRPCPKSSRSLAAIWAETPTVVCVFSTGALKFP